MKIKLIQDIIDFIRGKNRPTKLTKTDLILKERKNPLADLKENEKASTYYVEVLSECDLKCPICAFGSRDLFERKHGRMTLEYFEKILDKIKSESPSATVSPYHHCEPSLHPQLPEIVRATKERGLKSALSFNFNRLNRLEDLLKANPDSFEISVSGFYQETYSKSHTGGDIEQVKENLKILRETMDRLGSKTSVHIVYHMYKDNLGDDYDKMREFVKELGFHFLPCWSRSINIEMSLKYLREKGLSRYKGETCEWLDHTAPLKQKFHDTLDRMVHLPQDFTQGKWKDTSTDECPCDKRVINIRWTGNISLCGCGFDDRGVIGEYINTPLEELYKIKKTHPLCKECLANNYAFYTNYGDMDEIDKLAHSRLECCVPADRRFGG